MTNLEKRLWSERFSHIYIEEEAFEYAITQNLLSRFKHSRIIKIGHYKDVFCRANQSFQIQKESQKLILAVKKDTFLYKSPTVCQNFGNLNFYYSSTLLNCMYHCDYCYLQGMYPSANLVAFVNTADYFKAVDQALKEESMYLAVSYDTDLLSFEGVLPYTRLWLEYAANRPQLILEVRTKSANYPAISDIRPVPNAILAWTLSPQEVIEKYEKGSPSLAARLSAMKKAAGDGWNIRPVFDPVLKAENWKAAYKNLVQQVFSEIPGGRVRDVGLGAFRMSGEYLKRIKKSGRISDLLYYPFECREGVSRYSPDEEKEMIQYMMGLLQAHVDTSKIFIG